MSSRINRVGFTLVEMLVVIAIIATLTAIAVPTMNKLGMFGRDPLQVAARQTLVMLKAARIYAGANNVDTAVVYSIGLHKGPQVNGGTPVDIRVIDGVAMVRRLTDRDKEFYRAILDRMVTAGEISQADADARFNDAFVTGSEMGGDKHLPFVPVKGIDGIFTPLQRGAVLAPRDALTGHIYDDPLDVTHPEGNVNDWGDDGWGLSPIRVVDRELNVITPRTIKGLSPVTYLEYMPSDYDSLPLRFPAHVFKPSGILQTPGGEKARYVISVIPDPEAEQAARFLEDGRPVPAEEIEIYSTIGRIQAAS